MGSTAHFLSFPRFNNSKDAGLLEVPPRASSAGGRTGGTLACGSGPIRARLHRVRFRENLGATTWEANGFHSSYRRRLVTRLRAGWMQREFRTHAAATGEARRGPSQPTPGACPLPSADTSSAIGDADVSAGLAGRGCLRVRRGQAGRAPADGNRISLAQGSGTVPQES